MVRNCHQDYCGIRITGECLCTCEELKPPRASKNLKEFWEQAKLSKVLATIDTHAELEFSLEDAKHGNMFTKEAYTWFQKLQFKNLLGKFDVEAAENEVEKAFREVTEQEEIERIFSEAKKADVWELH